MKFRFYIYLNDDDSNLVQVYPNYKDDLAKETELETNQRFYRDKISGKMRLGNSSTVKDFDFVMSQPFDTQYNLVIEKTDDYGQTWNREYLGKFFQTDCKINYDDQSLEFQPDAIDDYTNVLSGIDKESNLADLPIEIQGVYLQKRPLIQIYIPGEETVSCFLSGMSWEQNVTEPTTDATKLTSVYKFSFTTIIKTMFIDVLGEPKECGGSYSLKTNSGAPFSGEIIGDNGYKVVVQINPTPGSPGVFYTTVGVFKISDGSLMFMGNINNTAGLTNNTIYLQPFSGTFGAIATFETKPIYARYLLDVLTINGVNTYPLPVDDLVDYNSNYTRAIGYAIDVIYTSKNFSDEPTQWGKNSSGKYFLPPTSMFGNEFYPIARTQWEVVSYWFAFNSLDSFLEVKGRASAFLKDSYPIYSVISALLKKYAPDIIHEGTPEFSQFLYGEINPIYQEKFRLFISQKTNLLNLRYQNPAQKTPMTLQTVMNMLRDCFRCFWYIEDKKLKIEHISWFKNGGAYVGDPLVAYDVTTMINIRNGKDWGFSTSEVTFDKVDMPERFQFKWMDDVSNAFEGMPIEVLSRYIMQGKIEDVNVSNFNSDVDYLLLNPSEISQDGFVLMAAVNKDAFLVPVVYGGRPFVADNDYSTERYEIKPESLGKIGTVKILANVNSGTGEFLLVFFDSSGGFLSGTPTQFADGTVKTFSVNVPLNASKIGVDAIGNVSGEFISFTTDSEFELPFIEQSVGGYDYVLQNGIVSFSVLQPNFYVYDLPAKKVEINGIETIVEVERKRKQTLSFPIIGEFNPMELVKTHIGLGQIDKISLNLHSRSAKTTLKYDTE